MNIIEREGDDCGLPKTMAGLKQFKQGAFDEKAPYAIMIAHPNGGWISVPAQETGMDRATVLRAIRRFKETYAPDVAWEEIANAPPREGVDRE